MKTAASGNVIAERGVTIASWSYTGSGGNN